MKSVLLLLAVTLGGCGVQSFSYPIIAPNGSSMVGVGCRGDSNYCLASAGKACPNGYEVVQPLAGGASYEEKSSLYGAANHGSAFVSGGSVKHEVYSGHMIVKCHAGPIVPQEETASIE